MHYRLFDSDLVRTGFSTTFHQVKPLSPLPPSWEILVLFHSLSPSQEFSLKSTEFSSSPSPHLVTLKEKEFLPTLGKQEETAGSSDLKP